MKKKMKTKTIAVLGITSLLTGSTVLPVWAAPKATGPAMAAAIAEEQKSGSEEKSAEGSDEITYQILMDNTMEYRELKDLIHEFNVTVRNNQTSLANSRNEENNEEMAAELEDEADDLEARAEELEDLYGDMTGMEAQAGQAMYANYIYNAKALKAYAKQLRDQAKGSGLSNALSKLKNEKVEMGLVASAQSMMNQYNQMKLQIADLNVQKELAQATYEAVSRKAASGLATEMQVTTAKDAVRTLEVSIAAQQNALESVRQNLCVMTGWEYNDSPDIQAIPQVDMEKVLAMDLESDRQQAFNNSYDRRIAAIEYTETASGNEKISKQRSLEQTEQTVKSSFEGLYDAACQSKSAYESAKTAYDMEKNNMDAADRKYQLGMMSQLEYLQQKAQFSKVETTLEVAELNLFQAMENYEWGKKGLIQSASSAS